MKTAPRNNRNCNRLAVHANASQESAPKIKYGGPSRPHPAVSRNHSTTASPLRANHMDHLWHTVEQTQHQAATALLDYLRQGKSAWERDAIIGQTILSQPPPSSSQQNNHHHQKPQPSSSSFINQAVHDGTRPWRRYYAEDPDDPDDFWGSSNASSNNHQQNSTKAQQQQHTSTSYSHTSDDTDTSSTTQQHNQNTSPWEEEQQEWTRAWSSWWDDAKKQHQGQAAGFGGHGGYYCNQQEKYQYYQQQQYQQQNYYNSTSSSSSSSYHNNNDSNNILPLGILPPAPPAGSTKDQIADWTAHRDISLLLQQCNGDITVFVQSLNVVVKEKENAKAAYRACLLRYHPDRLGGASVEEQSVGVYVTRALVYLFKQQ